MMTDTTQTTETVSQDLSARESALLAKEQEVEVCITKNKGVIMKSLNSLPAPVLVLVKGVVNVLLIPLHLLATLPLNSIYTSLRDFVGDGTGDCTPPAQAPEADCTTQDKV